MSDEKKIKEIKPEKKLDFKKRIGKLLAEGILALGLSMTPTKANAFYSIYPFTNYEKIEKSLENVCSKEDLKKIKSYYYSYGNSFIKNSAEIIVEIDESIAELERIYEETKNKAVFFVLEKLKMKKADALTIINDVEEKESILTESDKEIKELLKDDPYNVNLLELYHDNVILRIELYSGDSFSGEGEINNDYRKARYEDSLKIKDRKEKFYKTLEEYKKLHNLFVYLNDNFSKNKDKITSYFDLTNKEKKKIIKSINEKLEWEIKLLNTNVKIFEQRLNGLRGFP
ncbi:MAG: hypothetical protein QXW80_01685 [Candidatus Micrarchaeia archaeon]